jgi:Xaa-Pro dipeptidase
MRIISDKKIKQLREKLEENNIEAALFLNSEPIHDVNIEYFTGFQQTRFYSFSCLLIKKDMKLVVSKLSYDRAKEQATADEIINLADHDNSLMKFLKKELEGIKSLGIIERIFPYSLSKKFQDIKFRDINEIMTEIRSIKEKKEIDRIKKSCRICNHGIKVIEENLSTKITEKELSLIIEHELIRKGADELSFPMIVTSGKRSAFIHPSPCVSEKKISKGLGLVDFGVRYKGYCSDVTVPFSVGKLSNKQNLIVNTVKDTYNSAIESIKIDTPTWKIHESAENIIQKKGFVFKHSIGHGLGLKIHDLPSLSPRPSDFKERKEILLKEDMVFTIEPGIYEPGIGGCRLENDVLLKDKGPKLLTKSDFLKIE